MNNWLDPIVAALDEAHRPCPVFFRDDDAGWDDDALAALLDRFEEAGVAIDVAVIPDALTPDGASRLVRRAERGVVHLHQHGFRHANHQTEGRKCEFGDARGAARQCADIATGQARLQALLGPHHEPIFTPPWNRCTQSTADALVALGFAVLSREHRAAPLHAPELAEVPVTVDWFAKTGGQPWDLHERGRRIAASLRHTDRGGIPTGIMLHHAVTPAADLDAIAALVALLAQHPHAHNTNLMRLAS